MQITHINDDGSESVIRAGGQAGLRLEQQGMVDRLMSEGMSLLDAQRTVLEGGSRNADDEKNQFVMAGLMTVAATRVSTNAFRMAIDYQLENIDRVSAEAADVVEQQMPGTRQQATGFARQLIRGYSDAAQANPQIDDSHLDAITADICRNDRVCYATAEAVRAAQGRYRARVVEMDRDASLRLTDRQLAGMNPQDRARLERHAQDEYGVSYAQARREYQGYVDQSSILDSVSARGAVRVTTLAYGVPDLSQGPAPPRPEPENQWWNPFGLFGGG